ncbi:regulatory protein [Idiomarina fontislapidosi]|uniref:Regulatory protein RecX n=1 Tax=Idiomarina fontislapidosi TaxID=263723 RepID=A0A432XXD4_9GAMM|nr:regulatory protein RecX [Idiomarina fontislapidosi]PYE32109.1 regulatory protein [Idiomarina fontislapidosi]RUO53313.1 OraA [Idiomarina fontislapidosi]
MKSSDDDEQVLREKCFKLLTKREHSRFELIYKLSQRDFERKLIEQVVDRMRQEGWQSDERFAQSFAREKVMQRQGRTKIVAQATQQRGIDKALIEQALDQQEVDWFDLCQQVYQSKFGSTRPTDRKDWAKRARFLMQRGFSQEQIKFAIQANDDD